jgi:lipopolysaccharide/colanic/teichoic acid biosynthesis glycosyltransferase
MDVSLSALALVILSPVFLIVSLAIKLDSKGPVFFVQERVGKRGVLFKMYKFRSMVAGAEQKLDSLLDKNERDGPVFKILDDPRVTSVGKIIRRSCIDELPQLFNILRGDMSIVGPRPPLPREVQQYTAEQMKRLSIAPGLTCTWQIRKSEKMSFDEWVESDLEYICERSFKLDLKIIFATVLILAKRYGDE